MTPIHATHPYDWSAVLHLIQTCFASMEGRIDPPSSMHRLTAGKIEEQAKSGEIWVAEDTGAPVACMFLTFMPDCLYLGKIAIHSHFRGTGILRRFIDLAETRAKARTLPVLRLDARIELTENHRMFDRFGFEVVGTTAHAGYDRPTSLTMERIV